MENNQAPATISFEDFLRIEMRVGTIIKAEMFKEAIKPAYKLWVDFDEIGIKKTSAQITQLYKPKDLIGKQVIAVVNFPPKQIANFISECLVLGSIGEQNCITLLSTDKPVKNGLKIG
ncbi:tRNA-binding protein [Pedobacter sp. SD-b]|uniref:tRNA-binding protein n=1 Tax=Pedobacter segetis TaxID=2793069 RepID=A0ABS1BFU0_9SPHI|nr:tRNA-binding protein [Pedobacter segetis]MBK0381735.1 tRNA-binding protein [Pedobacter segetis]